MKVEQFRFPALIPPTPVTGLTLWLRSGQQLKGRIVTYDLNGLLQLQPPNGRPIVIDITEIAAVQFD